MQFVYPITNPKNEAQAVRLGGGGLVAAEAGELVQVNFTREAQGSANGYQPAAALPDGVLLSTHYTFSAASCPEFFARFLTQSPQPSLPAGWRFAIAIADADASVSLSDFEQPQSELLPYQIVGQENELLEYSRLGNAPRLLTTSVNEGYFVRFMMPAEKANLQSGKTYRLYFFAQGEWTMELYANPALPVYPQFVNLDAILPPDIAEQLVRDSAGAAGANARIIEQLLIKSDSFRELPFIRIVIENPDGSRTVREIYPTPNNTGGAQVWEVDLSEEEAVLNIGAYLEFVAPPNSSFSVQGRASASLSECLLCIMRQMSRLQKQGKLCIS
ncbi:hypothetical protein [Rhodoflexus sp.]